ncbi:hypothetical protein [Actinoplanes subglobosus]|uniref:Uncharacterized protein n=1 Tax=Actinoplanes subglobosus TaxID=1547892 RepID=A0ABV8IVN8_9ACTN
MNAVVAVALGSVLAVAPATAVQAGPGFIDITVEVQTGVADDEGNADCQESNVVTQTAPTGYYIDEDSIEIEMLVEQGTGNSVDYDFTDYDALGRPVEIIVSARACSEDAAWAGIGHTEGRVTGAFKAASW